MRKKHRSHKKALIGKDIVILPFLFCILIYALCAAVLMPSASSYVEIADMFFSDRETTFSSDYVNIFVPVEDKPETAPATETSVPKETSDDKDKDKKETPAPKPNPYTSTVTDFTFPSYGYQFGEIIIEDCQVHAKLFLGDDYFILKNGVGVYYGSSIPGYQKTILVAGHNNTYFNGLKYAEKGQIVQIRTNYGNYKYEITDIMVRDKSDSSAYDLWADEENLVLYTCYPFDDLGLPPTRLFVHAKLVSGPIIDKIA